MFDSAIFYVLCFIPGKIIVWVFTAGKYTTSIADEMSEPFANWDSKKQADGRVVVSHETVTMIGFLFWVGVLFVICIGFYTKTFDLVTPLRSWLFE